MKYITIFALASAALSSGVANAATIAVLDFEDVVPDNGAQYFNIYLGQSYLEDGMRLEADYDTYTPNGIFGKDYIGPGQPVADHDNGSAFFGWCNVRLGDALPCGMDLITLTQAQGYSFDLASIDASHSDYGELPGDIVVTGFYAGGGSISAVLDLQLNTWETFAFDSAWTGLSSVTLAGTGEDWHPAIDNIVVSTVPVPAAVWLFGSALAGLGWISRRKITD